MSVFEPTLFDAPPSAERLEGERIASVMLTFLVLSGRWLTRAWFTEHCKLTERECRLGCQYSAGRILDGNRGYKAAHLASIDEWSESLGRLESQIRVMQSKLVERRQAYHSFLESTKRK